MAFAALSAAEGEGMSKSAKRRANKKAREAEGAVDEQPPAPAAKAKAAPEQPSAKAAAKAAAKSAPAAAPAPKAKAEAAPKAKAKADAAPKAKAEAKAKASPAQAPAPAPDQPMSNAAKKKARQAAAAAAAEAEAKAAAEAAAAAQAKAAAEAAAAAKAAAKAKGKAKAKAEPKKEEPVKTPEPVMPVELDDGTGAAWDTVATTKKQKPKEKKQEDKAAAPATKSAPASGGYPAAKAKAAPAPAAMSAEDKAARFEALKAKIKEEAKAEALAAHVAYVASKPKADGEEGEASAEAKAPSCVRSIKVPEGAVGRIIGPKGATLELIKEKCGVNKIDTAMGMATILGDTDEACAKAEAAIKELIEKGYMSIAYENLKEDKTVVMSPDLPDIIGKKGSIISKIKEELSVEIDIPRQKEADEKDKAPKVTKVEIKVAGEADKVEQAKEVINSIVMYGHHEITHPGMAHKEIEAEEHQYRYIIGRAGSEMRHIQNSYRVAVRIPRDYSKNKKVVVVGEQLDVDRAVAYIEKAIGNAENEQKDREKQQAEREANRKSGPDRDDDGPIEPWMKQYMRNKK
eukprot:TRINITY_DN136_c0_g2_i1.p1 TRINITY_DN136_c0_g2~~TRINITY_DN136_c0_g2_i1.p1  ORF type:complete len:573 (+),score=219.31 TRINITY_DN136_c0_g2_i1:70-1788(+)